MTKLNERLEITNETWHVRVDVESKNKHRMIEFYNGGTLARIFKKDGNIILRIAPKIDTLNNDDLKKLASIEQYTYSNFTYKFNIKNDANIHKILKIFNINSRSLKIGDIKKL